MHNKQTLVTCLNNVIRENSNKRIMKKQVDDFFAERNINAGGVTIYWTGNKPLEDADDIVLLLFSHILYTLTEVQSINPEKYFGPVEILDGLRWKNIIDETNIEFPLVIQNVMEITTNQWLTKIDIKTLKEWYYGIPLVYNFDTQRQAKLKFTESGDIIRLKSTNQKTVAIIAERMCNNKQFPDTLTLNLLSDGEEHVSYDAEAILMKNIVMKNLG